MLLACLASVAARAEETPVVAAIEAAYLMKFSDFVGWPTGDADSLCVLAQDTTARLIEQAEGKLPPEAPHPRYHRLASAAEAAGCRVLFIGETADVATPALAGGPMLTVTDRAAEGHKGIINFVIRDDRVRFEIDDAEAGRRGLTISSKLLSLAVAVKPRT